ncbi:hypothetical protein D3C73_869840 [compost metagenome]
MIIVVMGDYDMLQPADVMPLLLHCILDERHETGVAGIDQNELILEYNQARINIVRLSFIHKFNRKLQNFHCSLQTDSAVSLRFS